MGVMEGTAEEKAIGNLGEFWRNRYLLLGDQQGPVRKGEQDCGNQGHFHS